MADAVQELSDWIKGNWRRLLAWVTAGLVVLLFLSWALFPSRAPAWSGFSSPSTPAGYRTLWDWLDLLLQPAAVGVAAWWLGHTLTLALAPASEGGLVGPERLTGTSEQNDRLKDYFDRMTDLLLTHQLSSPRSSDEVRQVARASTIAILGELSPEGKGEVVRFLRESGLIVRPEVIIALGNVDLTGARLQNANLSKVDLHHGLLAGAVLSGARLDETVLTEADLTSADLRGAHAGKQMAADGLPPSLHRAKLDGATLDELAMPEVDLGEASLLGASLENARLAGAVLRGAKLAHASLRSADLKGANFTKADLEGADLSGVNLAAANLSGARLVSARLNQADLYQANLRRADLSDSRLRGARLVNAFLQRANLRGADLRGADLRGANLSGADLMDALLDRADLGGAFLSAAKVERRQLERCLSTEGATIPAAAQPKTSAAVAENGRGPTASAQASRRDGKA